jgi:hypothetical protein
VTVVKRVRAAADAGTEIHAAIQSFYEEKPHDFVEHVWACDTEITQCFGEQFWIVERSFSHELGYGGKVDLHSTKDKGIVIDIKTKDFFDKDKVEAYDEHLMQLAAYRVGLGLPEAQCANVFVSRRVAGLTKMIEWTERDLQRAFGCLLTYCSSGKKGTNTNETGSSVYDYRRADLY